MKMKRILSITVALLLLSGVAARETNKYLWGGRLDEDMEDIANEETAKP